MSKRLIITTLVLLLQLPLFGAPKDSTEQKKSVVGETLKKVFSSKKEGRKRRTDTFKRNNLGTKMSTFSVGLELEPTLIARRNFHHSVGANLLFGGSLDHFNKWLFFKMGTHKYDLGKDDLLYGLVKDSTLFGFTLGFKYKSYFPHTVDRFISPYIMLEIETEAIIWEYIANTTNSDGSSVKNDLVSNYIVGSGGGFTIFNRNHLRVDFSFSGGIRFYQERTMVLEDGTFETYNTDPFETDFYLRSGFTIWITREN